MKQNPFWSSHGKFGYIVAIADLAFLATAKRLKDLCRVLLEEVVETGTKHNITSRVLLEENTDIFFWNTICNYHKTLPWKGRNLQLNQAHDWPRVVSSSLHIKAFPHCFTFDMSIIFSTCWWKWDAKYETHFHMDCSNWMAEMYLWEVSVHLLQKKRPW